ncbi:MAG: SDR family NAD(P)-dependent oxidoreductase [Bacillota bacterium]
MQLAGKVAIITGGGKGIGRAIALAFAREGARLVLAARDEAAMAEVAEAAAPAEVLCVRTDVADEAQVGAMAAAALERFGTIDILVNNSGIPGPTRPIWEMEPSEWDEVIAVNLRGAYLCCRAVLPHMVSRRSGRVINISSILGREAVAGRSPYCASKAALVGMTRAVAEEVGPYGITANLVSPGATAGDRLDLVLSRLGQARGMSLEQVREWVLRDSALRRFVNAEDVGKACVFLASDAAANITGEDLNLTAGRAMW